MGGTEYRLTQFISDCTHTYLDPYLVCHCSGSSRCNHSCWAWGGRAAPCTRWSRPPGGWSCPRCTRSPWWGWTAPGWATPRPWTPGSRASEDRSGRACWRWRPASPQSRSHCWASRGWRSCARWWAWYWSRDPRVLTRVCCLLACRAGTGWCSWALHWGGWAWCCHEAGIRGAHWRGSQWTSSNTRNTLKLSLFSLSLSSLWSPHITLTWNAQIPSFHCTPIIFLLPACSMQCCSAALPVVYFL